MTMTTETIPTPNKGRGRPPKAAEITPQDAARELLTRRHARENLYEYIKAVWPIMEPGYAFRDGWMVGALAEHLQAVIEGEIRFLLINMPPRLLKTATSGVAMPSWAWIQRPELKFLYASYSHALALDASLKCRNVIRSRWYQARWGDRFSIRDDRDTKDYYANDRGGERLITSTDGTTTGRGGDVIVCLPSWVLVETSVGPVPAGELVDGRIDCRVLSFNHETGETELKAIESYETNPGRDLVEIDLGDRTLTCTEDHEVHVEGRGYVRAIDIEPGDVVSVLPELRWATEEA